METESDPREWLRQEQQQIAKLRNRAERAHTKVNAAAIALWVLALVIAVALTVVAWPLLVRVGRGLR